jgi:multiple antibiotic resistance protein
MGFVEATVLLFIVVDPFGNLPFIMSILERLDRRSYNRAILRELAIAFALLCLFLFAGDTILDYINVRESSVRVAGGIILLIIALQMIFRTASEMFSHDYGSDPMIVPIAMPSVAGPSAVTTVIILKTDPRVGTWMVLGALSAVFIATLLLLLAGRMLLERLGPRALRALEKFMGMLLSLIAVDMILVGVREMMKGTS